MLISKKNILGFSAISGAIFSLNLLMFMFCSFTASELSKLIVERWTSWTPYPGLIFSLICVYLLRQVFVEEITSWMANRAAAAFWLTTGCCMGLFVAWQDFLGKDGLREWVEKWWQPSSGILWCTTTLCSLVIMIILARILRRPK